ncbi:MAG: transposase, partial [Caldilineaceae bacterium]|nr:transposase [Caldilineaceae bacterium]
DLYVYCVSFRGLSRLLALLGCGVGAATLWRDVQAVAPSLAPDPQADLPSWVEVDETWLSLGGAKRPVAVVLGPQGERLDLRLSGPGLDWANWFTDLAARGVQGLTTDDDPVYGPALEAAGLDRQQCAVHMQRTVERHIRGLDKHDLTHRDRVLLPILRRLARARPPEAGPVLRALWEAVMQGRVRLHPEVRKLLWHLVERWHELVRSQDHPRVPASTNRLEGWSGALRARFKPRARLK